jgi:hypothetical protein
MPTSVIELDRAFEKLANAKDRDDHNKMLCALAPVAAADIATLASNFGNSEFPKLDAIWALIGQTGDAATCFATR